MPAHITSLVYITSDATKHQLGAKMSSSRMAPILFHHSMQYVDYCTMEVNINSVQKISFFKGMNIIITSLRVIQRKNIYHLGSFDCPPPPPPPPLRLE